MVYSEVDIGTANSLGVLDRLEESSNIEPSMVLVRESKLKHKNLVRLEEVTKFVQENNISLREALESIAKVNNLNMESFGFPVFPSNLIEDVAVYQNAIILKEEGFPIYINNNPGDTLNECFSIAIAEAVTNGNTETFDTIVDILDEGIMDAIVNPAVQRATKASLPNIMGATANAVRAGAKEGIIKGGENIVNRRAFGYFNNKTVNDPDESGKKISQFDAHLKRYVPNQDARDLIGGTIKGVTGNISREFINNLYNFVSSGGTTHNPQEIYNNLTHNGAVLANRIGNTKDPRTSNMLQRMYDKLINLKNKIKERIRAMRGK